MTSSAHHKPSRSSFQFNPLEISFCGLSGSGKTTLIEKLARRWHERGHHFAYIKHDAHRFEMDKQGKDTQRIRQAGAACIHITDAQQFAQIESRTHSSLMPNLSLLNHDFVVIEGYKSLSVPKLVTLDDSLEIMQHLGPEQHQHIIAFCGSAANTPEEIKKNFPKTPYFQRDQISDIDRFIELHLETKIHSRPLNGLVLCGGKSERMGQDKSFLQYVPGKSQLERTNELLESICDQIFVSARPEQVKANSAYQEFPLLFDSFLGLGPLSGIFSALKQDPQAAWLVVAIDLPFLSQEGIRNLICYRRGFAHATAFRSTCQTRIEPLCAIYEPKSFPAMLSMLGIGFNCPTKMLRNMRVQELVQSDSSQLLANANTPEEYRVAKLSQGAGHESNA